MFVDQKIQVAFEPARPVAHLAAPDDQLKINRALAEFLEIDIWRRLAQRGRMFAGCRDEGLAHFVYVAAVGHAHWHAEAHAWIAVSPVRHRRVDEFRVRHDHRDVIVG